jgi:DNA primase
MVLGIFPEYPGTPFFRLAFQDFNIKIVTIGKDAKDPDELIRKNPKAWEKAVLEAKPFFEFYIEKLFAQVSVLSVEAKKHIRDEILPLLKKLNDSLEQEHYLKFLAQKLEVTSISLKEDLNRFGKVEYKKPQALPARQVSNKAILETEKQVLGGMLLEPKYLEIVLKEGEVADFTTPEIMTLAESLFKHQTPLENTLAKEAVFMVELLKQESASEAAFQKDLTNAFFALRAKNLKQKQQSLQKQIVEAEARKDLNSLQDLQKQFLQVSQLINKYKF